MNKQVRIEHVHAEDLDSVQVALIHVCEEAFAGSPTYLRRNAFTRMLALSAQNRGFFCCLAKEAETGLLLGCAFGREVGEDMWWYSALQQTLDSREWLESVFLLEILAVRPSVQRHGIGRLLHNDLLEAIPQPAVLLTTLKDSGAYLFYKKLQWTLLEEHFHFPGYSQIYSLMGKRKCRGRA